MPLFLLLSFAETLKRSMNWKWDNIKQIAISNPTHNQGDYACKVAN